MSRTCLKVALVVLTLGVVLYCLPSILPGENDVISPAAEDADVSSDLMTITTYTGHPEGHLITFPDGTTMSIDCGYKYGDADTITTVSHFHVDHCAECGSGILAQYNRNNVVPGDVIYSDEDRNITVTVVAANGAVIGQEPAGPYPCGGDENHWSMALLVQYGGFDYLTAGDLDTGGEWPLGAALKEGEIHVDVFKVSHHGSRTSTDINFLLDILPEYAVIAGGGSEPTVDTLSKLVYVGVKTVYYTHSYPVYPGYPICWALNGKLVITTDGDTYSISSSSCDTGPVDVDKTPTPTLTPTETPTWDPSVPTYTPTATPTLRPEGPWPMFRYDSTGAGQSRYFTGPQKGQLAWSYATSEYVEAKPVVGFDGRVCVGSDDNSLYAITSSGALMWSYLTGGDFISAAAISSDGTVHVGAYDDNFYALTSAGLLLWSHRTGGDIRSSAVIDSAGRIYVGSDDNVIYAFSFEGGLEWSYETADNASSSPAVGIDGNIYTGSEDNVFYALSPAGYLIWSYSIGDSYLDWGTMASSPAIKSDGSICVGSGYGRLYTFSSTGAFLWYYPTAKNCPVASPVIDRLGNIYVGAVGADFCELTPPGRCRWSYRTGDVFSSAAIGVGGDIYVGATNRNMYALTSAGCLTWSYMVGHAVRSSPAIGCDGYVYVGSHDTRLYAFKDPPTLTPTPTVTPTPTETPTVTPTPTPTTPPTATIPPLVVLPGALAVGQNFSVFLSLTEDITQPFDFYFFVDTPVGFYTIYLNGLLRKGIMPLYSNVPKFNAPYCKTVRPAVRIPAGMSGKTVTFHAVVMQAGKKPPLNVLTGFTQDTSGVIMSNEASATISP